MIAVEMMVAPGSKSAFPWSGFHPRLHAYGLSHVDRSLVPWPVRPIGLNSSNAGEFHVYSVGRDRGLLDSVVDCRGAVYAAARRHDMPEPDESPP